MNFKLKFKETFNITKDPVQPITITENGVYDAGKGGFNPVEVRVEGNKDLIDCESLPTEGVQAGKIYRARWSETVEIPPDIEIWVTDGDGSEPYTSTLEELTGVSYVVEVNSIDEIPSEEDGDIYLCNTDGILYVSQTVTVTESCGLPREANAGFIGSPDELDVNKMLLGLIKVGSEIVTTNYEQIGISSTDANVEFVIRDNTSWKTITPLQKYIDALGVSTLFRTQKNMVTATGLIKYSDISNVTSTYNMFRGCSALTEVPLLDTSNVTDMTYMFYECGSLYVVPSFDTRNVINMFNMFYACTQLIECWIKNIKTSLQVGSGTDYGHLLTVDSLVHLIYELRDTGSSKTLTVGSANLEKLANVYVRLIDITDEMRAEDDLIDEKLPFEVCESTDEGAMLITDYAYMKKWNIK